MSSTDDAVAVKREAQRELMALPGVVAVGFGTKEVGDRLTGDLAIRVYVRHKRPLADLAPEDRVPSRIHGVDTDVVVEPPFHLDNCFPESCMSSSSPTCHNEDLDERRYRPLRGGISIQLDALPDVVTGFGRDLEGTHQGTLGFIGRSTRPGDNGALVAVTAEHLAMTLYATGVPVAQASLPDNLPDRRDAIIGTTWRGLQPWEDVDGQGNTVHHIAGDGATIKLASGIAAFPWIEGIGWITGSKRVQDDELGHGYPVRKRGMRTGLTYGLIVDAHKEWPQWFDGPWRSGALPQVLPGDPDPVDCPYYRVAEQLLVRPVKHHDVSMCGASAAQRGQSWAGQLELLDPWDDDEESFSCSGDSGSAVVDDCNRIVGLHWAGSTSTPIGVLEDGLDIEVFAWEGQDEYEWVPGTVPVPSQLPPYLVP